MAPAKVMIAKMIKPMPVPFASLWVNDLGFTKTAVVTANQEITVPIASENW